MTLRDAAERRKRRARRHRPAIVPMLAAIAFAPLAHASPAPSNLPPVDFARMGTVGLGGSFAGLDWWQPRNSSSTRFSTDGDTVFVREADGDYRPLGATNAGGRVRAVCEMDGTIYAAGTFTSLGGQSASNIASYSGSWRGLGAGLTGQVNALYCTGGEVWAGGEFSGPTNVSNVALWNGSWQTVPFGGLNGPVNTISSSDDGLFFGGSFSTLYASTSNSTNYTSIPSAPSNTSTTGNSGFLTPVTLPGASSASGDLVITAGPSTADSQYNNPRVLLCPGNGTWLAREGQVSEITLLGYNFWRATGARITNGLAKGRGTKTFCITSIPDNKELNMTYTDPVTGQNQTCAEHCPLSTDPSIGAQDFLFTNGVRNMTGLKMQLKEWTGEGAGMSSIQLLSDGAYASAAENGNTGVCPGPTSRSGLVGDWRQGTVSTSLPATTTYFLQSTVTDSTPGVTFYPYVSSSAYYDVYLTIPACEKTEDCASRTTVDVEVFPVGDGLGWTSTISQVTSVDLRTLVYSGWIDRTTGEFTPTIILQLARDRESTSSGQYSVVAQSVELHLTGVGTPDQPPRTSPGGVVGQNGTLITNSTSVRTRRSYGVFEWDRGNVSALGSMPNRTETTLARLGYQLPNGTVNAIVQRGDDIIIGGSLGNWSNVVSINANNETSTLPEGGLNEAVLAGVEIGGRVYLGGNFTATGNGKELRYIAMYNGSWSAVAGGVDGPVLGLAARGNNLYVTGNFTHVISNGESSATGGYAVYDTQAGSWNRGGVLFGSLSAVAPGDDTVLAGRVVGGSSNSANGIAMLTTGSDGAEITTLQGVSFSSNGSASSLTRRSWFSRLKRDLLVRAPAPTIPAQSSPAPAILAGGFWRNSSNEVTILGGNFSSPNIGGLAFYGGNLTGPSPPVSGVVRAIAVVDHTLFVAGSGVNVTGVGAGLVAYDLSQNQWAARVPALSTSQGQLRVNALKLRQDTHTLVAAGNFGQAGSLGCAAVCLWSTTNNQWQTPGTGLSSGEVRAIDFAGNDYDTLVVAGSFALSSGSVAYVATYSFGNSTWTALGSLPGPALALAVDNKNVASVFVSGYDESSNEPYLSHWDGSSWSAQNASILPGSIISQLAFVPLTSAHDARGSIERDRMLMMSGNIRLGQGNVTSALYDGSTTHPYLVGIANNGELGSAGGIFWSESSFDFSIRNYLAVGLVVLVAIAIATGLILLLILLFLLIGFCLRRRERRNPPPEMYNRDVNGSDIGSTHQNVLHTVQDAIQATLLGGAAGGAAAAATKHRSAMSGDSAYTDDAGAVADDEEEDEGGRETTMRYDFDGPDLQPGEMSMRSGQAVVVLDDQQSGEWWYCRDPATGREGVVPATYVW